MSDTIEMSESLKKALGHLSTYQQQREEERVKTRVLFLADVVGGLAEKGNNGTFFNGNPEAGTAHRVGLREGAAVVMEVIDRLDLSLDADDCVLNLHWDGGDTYSSVSMAEAFAQAINS